MIKIAIIGNGSFGKKRADAVKLSSRGVLSEPADADVIIISTPPSTHLPIAVKAFRKGKHVLCEKPLATNVYEAKAIVKESKRAGKFLKLGSNHRYFANINKAYNSIMNGDIGEVLKFDGRIGHDGERIKGSWYWDRSMSGGGTLIDNGHHLIDLARCFVGDFVRANGIRMNLKWRCFVEDRINAIMTTEEGKIAIIQSSWCQDDEYMHIVITGSKGVMVIDDNKLTINNNYFKYNDDNSLVLEIDEFLRCIEEGIEPSPSGEDGIEILKLIEQIYD